MLLRRRMPVAAFVALLTLALAACTPSQPTPSPAPTSAPTPLFSSDAAALKAATEAYAAYLKMSDTISHDGGADPERIKPYVTAAQFQRELNGFDALKQHGVRTTGSTAFGPLRLASWSGGAIQAYVCLNASDVHVVDSGGHDVTPAGREKLTPFQIDFKGAARNRALVSRSEIWSGKTFC